MSRVWVAGEGWQRTDPPKGCATCGGPVRPQVGKGRPFKFCDEHAPARRDSARQHYDATNGRERLRDYQRSRFGSRPLIEFECADCGELARRFVRSDVCESCEKRASRARLVIGGIRHLACIGCGVPVEAATKATRIACTDCRYELTRSTNRRKYLARRRGVVAGERYRTDEIGDRDGWRCHLCRKPVDRSLRFPKLMSPTVDHLVPIADGGLDVRTNVALAHLICNVRRSRAGTVQLRALA